MNAPKFLTFIVVALAGALSAESAAAATAVVAWGSNSYGQTNVPPGLTNIAAISANELHTVALRADGTVVSWGVGDNRTNVPPGLSNVVAVAAGGMHSVAVKRDGTVVAWSCCGSLWGLTNAPPGLTNVVRVACGHSCVLALKGDGSVVSWGDPDYTNLPPGLAPVTAIAAGYYHNLAIKPDGTVVAWGDNTFNQTNVPTGLSNVIAVAAGQGHSLALRRDGTVVGWGFNNSQQATPPNGLSNVVAIAAGGIHSMALKSDGTLVPWGDPFSGQNNIPSGATNVSLVADGSDFSVAVTGRLPLGTNADLAALVLSAGTLTPAFNAATTNYTATVFHNITNLTVTTTSMDTNATIQVRVNGSAFSNIVSGIPSPPLPLNVGTNRIDLKVTAQDLTTMKTYTVAVTRLTNQPPVAFAIVDRTNGAAPLTVCFDGSQSYDPEGGPLGYYWEFADGSDYSTNAMICHTFVQPGRYTVTFGVADERSAYDFDYLTINVFAPVAITTQPISQTILAGQNAGFNVTATGTEPVSYQWRFNGTNLAGFTTATCTITNAQTNNAGPYTVVVTDLYSSITSSVATLTVLVGPHVLTELATAVTTNSATLNGAVNTNWLPSTAWFEWGTWTNYGHATTPVALSAACHPVTVSIPLNGLAFNTAFHFRLVATNSQGMAYGGDQSFTTLTPFLAFVYPPPGLIITNPTPAMDDNFGSSVAALGANRIIVGAALDDTGGTDAGAVYLFSSNRVLLATITNPAPATGEQFGAAVAAVGGDYILVGAPRSNLGAADAGAAYLFDTNGTFFTTFTNPTPASGDRFGSAVAALGTDRVLIGAYGDDTGATDAGAAYVFSTNGELLLTYTNPAPASRAWFGYSVAAPTTTSVLIGAPYDSTFTNGAGAAYLFSATKQFIVTNTPAARGGNTTVWTDSEMIIWGGEDNSGYLADGWRYNPATDIWTAVTTNGAPSARDGHSAIWTGSKMIVWGGWNYSSSFNIFNDGACDDPAPDSWMPVGANGSPAARGGHTAVWTGSEMIVWGGYGATGELRTGARYNPVANTWTAVTTNGAPTARYYQTAIWTGSEMIIWGGQYFSGYLHYLNDGGRYNPAANTWTAVTASGAPPALSGYTTVWTGSQMIIWGGSSSGYVNKGWRYNPATDSWTAVTTNGAPAARCYHSAVWTGGEMIVWGGAGSSGYLSDGSRYNPATDNWTAITTNGAPAARDYHTAVWTGSEMIVWGGGWNAGGRYNPTADSWTPVSGPVFYTTVFPNSALLVTFTNPAPALGDRFGYSAATMGTDRVLIGAPGSGTGVSNAGAAYLFDLAGNLLTTFTNPTPATDDRFGASVAAAGNNCSLIGAPGEDAGAVDSGAAYLFAGWGDLLLTLPNPGPADADYFGCALTAAGPNWLVGARGNGTGAVNAGAAYLFTLYDEPPVAEAGPNQTIYTRDTTYLHGSASDLDSDAIIAWSWYVVEAPAGSVWYLYDEDRPTAQFYADKAGDYTIGFAVADANYNASLSDYVTIHVRSNLPPVAIATVDKTNGLAPLTVCFDGSQSYDPEGGPLIYDWDLDDGSNSTNATVCHTYVWPGSYTVFFGVGDERNGFDLRTFTITIPWPPVARATASTISGPSPLPVQFDGSQSYCDAGRTLTFLWNFGDGNTSTNMSPTHIFAPGLYTVTLTVTDDMGQTAATSLQLLAGHIGNWPPVAEAGASRWVATNAVTILNGSATDHDGQPIVSWSWTVVPDSTNALYSLANPADPHSAFSAQTPGTYVLSLDASDGIDWSLPDTMTIWVGIDMPPVADAGPDQAMNAGQTAYLHGSAIYPEWSSIVFWGWYVVEGPVGSEWLWQLNDSDKPTAQFQALMPGDYVLSLTVVDANGNFSAQDYVTVHVAPPRLLVALTSTNTVLLAWPAALTNYDLQQNADLTTTNWLPVTDPPVVIGSEKQVLVPPASARNFYRLHKP